eukprot:comp17222_c0_seq1/m.16208 comp17222_c0_seq1/g.16208  ORF comp17222_c0_seq1/g.16208 comp17222_c0_seq1/m.16208 type:complete len:339 (-) comp17222_c0_seq1:394-1410(-)
MHHGAALPDPPLRYVVPTAVRLSQDVGNIVLFEHLNVTIPDQRRAHDFFCWALGLSRDPYTMVTGHGGMWVNVGLQQFHLPHADTAQRLRGAVGLLVPRLDEVLNRLGELEQTQLMVGSRFKYEECNDWPDQPPFVFVTGRYGNHFKIFGKLENDKFEAEKLASSGMAPPKPIAGAVNSNPFRHGVGIMFLELECRRGTSQTIGRFYEAMFGALWEPIKNEDGETVGASVLVGPQQDFRFIEVDNLGLYDHHHVCIYIAQFTSTFKKFAAKNLIDTKHVYSDKVTTVELALECAQFRTREITDLETGEIVLQLEHEVRSLCHPNYHKPLFNGQINWSA